MTPERDAFEVAMRCLGRLANIATMPKPLTQELKEDEQFNRDIINVCLLRMHDEDIKFKFVTTAKMFGITGFSVLLKDDKPKKPGDSKVLPAEQMPPYPPPPPPPAMPKTTPVPKSNPGTLTSFLSTFLLAMR